MFVSLISLFLLLTPVWAYGRLGHYTIGKVVYDRLSNTTKDKITSCQWLAKFDGDMGKASVWADVIKGYPGYRWTKPLHYYDVDNDPPAFCSRVTIPDDGGSLNLLNALRWATHNLSIHGDVYGGVVPTEQCGSHFHFRMLLHLMQDIYQPLHLTGKESGGNEQYFSVDGKRYNLHTFWDSILLKLLLDGSSLDHSVAYFADKAQFDIAACRGNWTNYLYAEANWISQQNCRIVWNYDDPDYMDNAKNLVEKLILRSIASLHCTLEYLLS